MGYKTREWRNSMRVTLDYNNMTDTFLGDKGFTSKKLASYASRANAAFKYVNENDSVYFVHSYYAENCEESLLATAEYGKELTAAVAKNNVAGTQFHPEKSGKVGLAILKAFSEW